MKRRGEQQVVSADNQLNMASIQLAEAFGSKFTHLGVSFARLRIPAAG